MASYILLTVGICIIFTAALHYIRNLIGWSILDEAWFPLALFIAGLTFVIHALFIIIP
jgi:hypothetical protein